MRAFEIHTFHKGRWKIDSVFDDRELAVFEAKRMDDSGRYSGVRVVEETFDEQKQKTATRTVYRGSKATQANEDEFRRKADIRRKADRGKRRKAAQGAASQKAAKIRRQREQTNPYRLVAIVSLLGMFALAALYGLEHFQRTM